MSVGIGIGGGKVRKGVLERGNRRIHVCIRVYV